MPCNDGYPPSIEDKEVLFCFLRMVSHTYKETKTTSYHHSYEIMVRELCKACKNLSREEMRATQYGSAWSLFDWYKKHLLNDYQYNYHDSKEECEIVLKEAERLNLEIKTILSFTIEDKEA